MKRALPRSAGRLPRLLMALFAGGIAAALVFGYVSSVEQRASVVVERPTPTPPPRARVVVARAELPARTLLLPEMLELRELPAEAVGPGALTSVDVAAGRQLVVPVAPGEQLLPGKLRAPVDEPGRLAQIVPPGKRAISLAFSEVRGAGGNVLPGDHVDVIATFKKEVMGKDQSMILLQDVPVLAIGQTTRIEPPAPPVRPVAAATPAAVPQPGGKDQDDEAPVLLPAGGAEKVVGVAPTPTPVPLGTRARTLTLAVAPEFAERLALAEELGTLRYALRRAGDADRPNVAPTDLATLRSPLQPGAAEIVAVEISPTNVKVGDTLNVKVTVKNTSNKPLATQGPAPGYTYVQGQTYYSQQFPAELGKWRVGVGSAGLDATELPFRWGFGADLPPGASTTVTGQVKVTHDFKATSFWAAVVEEPANVVQNGAGMTLVTALPENVAVVAVDVANVRSGPSIASSVMDQLKYGTQVEIVGQSADWFKVRLPDQRQGWVAAGWIVAAGR